MDSSNAEKAWQGENAAIKSAYDLGVSEGFASRDAEVAELERQIQGWVKSATEAKDAHRAEVGVLREQLAAAEAVIEKVRDEANAIIDTTRENGTDFERGQENVSERVFDVLSVHPSVVLGDRDRELAARAVEEASRLALWRDRDSAAREHLDEYAATLRSGTEGSGS